MERVRMLPARERLEYIWMYYWHYLLAMVVLLSVVSILCVQGAKQRPQAVFYVQPEYYSVVSSYLEDIPLPGYDGEPEEGTASVNILMDSQTGIDMTTQLLISAAAGEADCALVTDELLPILQEANLLQESFAVKIGDTKLWATHIRNSTNWENAEAILEPFIIEGEGENV